jgi:general stress protein YciG
VSRVRLKRGLTELLVGVQKGGGEHGARGAAALARAPPAASQLCHKLARARFDELAHPPHAKVGAAVARVAVAVEHAEERDVRVAPERPAGEGRVLGAHNRHMRDIQRWGGDRSAGVRESNERERERE